MAATITQDQWLAVRSSLADAGERFASLVETAPDPSTLATDRWTIAETAAHTASVAWMYASVLTTADARFPMPELKEQVDRTSVDTVAHLNVAVMEGYYTERDQHAIAERLRSDLAVVLKQCEQLDPAKPMRWIGSANVPLAGMLAHLLNEILVHGLDIAKAMGTTWAIDSAQTAHFFEFFVMNIAGADAGHLLDNDEPPSDRRIAVEFRSKYTTAVTLVLQHGQLSREEPGGPTDVKISFDPTTLDLMMFGRVSQASSVLSGKVKVWGRRPWLLPVFLKTVRMPS
ncbi:uncharacterized protein (TIGR03083 family) [Allocatelliglobosispora scoriae]|uniref:Uncharacterized protein (TIGR03083 family) n=1 Tax=Allocatelliglobosispora scoriae TaxID=643052 RepID=A0A841BP39_9ACTN|nr:maleylpyruvate isomerase N-terminal domain-containing protein [Allocatelliglobosispora scoriae]MBB5870034.1 uncharacterized protein (TIGR03083 family) [Allocatelliglobosispora scoriae]